MQSETHLTLAQLEEISPTRAPSAAAIVTSVGDRLYFRYWPLLEEANWIESDLDADPECCDRKRPTRNRTRAQTWVGLRVSTMRCPRCHEVKPVEDFYKVRPRRSTAYCKKCGCEYSAARRKKNKSQRSGIPPTRQTPCRKPQRKITSKRSNSDR